MAATASIIMTAVSTAISVAGSIAQGQAQSRQANFQAEVARKQGELSEMQSRSQAADIELEAQRTRAQQINQAAGAGLDISDSDTLWDVINASQKEAESERQSILRAGQMNRATYGLEAQQYANAGKSGRQASWINAGTSLLKGTTQVVSIADKAGWFD